MKINNLFHILIMLIFVSGTACSQNNQNNNNSETSIMYLHIGDRILTATLVDNSSTRALRELLAANPVIINMSDYGNFEKVGNLGTTLPQNNQQITTQSGDLILYQGNQFVIYYDRNSWSLTRLGRINNVSQQELRNILGAGNVTVTLSLSQNL
jgi:hypothetical protein